MNIFIIVIGAVIITTVMIVAAILISILIKAEILKQGMNLCPHCHGDIYIRNPKGFCDHLHYPENCEFCLRVANKQ